MSQRKGHTYLVLKPHGKASLRVTRATLSAPSLKAGEIAFRINLAVPSRLFQSPALSADIELPDSFAPMVSSEVDLTTAEEDPETVAKVEVVEP